MGKIKVTFVYVVYIVFLFALGIISTLSFDNKIKKTVGWVEIAIGGLGAAGLIALWVTWFITAKSAGKLPAGTKNVAVKYILPWLVMGWGIIYSGLAIVKLIEKDSDAIKDINITMIVVSLVMSILVGLFLWWLVKKGGLTSSSATAGIDISVDDLMTL